MTFDRATLAALAAPYGLVSYTQLVEAGCSRPQLRNLLRTGRLRRIARGIYAVRRVVDLPLRVRGLLSTLPPEAAASHATAAALYGADLPVGDGRVEILVPWHRDVAPRPGLLVRRAAMEPTDVVVIGGLRRTVPGRTAVDLGRTRPLVEGVVAIDALLHVTGCTVVHVAPALAAATGLRGVRRARQAMALAEPLAESVMETALRLVLLLGGLPRPTPQLVVLDQSGGFVARVDLGYPETRLALEYDGRAAHLEPGAFRRERSRQNALVRCGWTVLRYTAADVLSSPHQIVSDVQAHLLLRVA